MQSKASDAEDEGKWKELIKGVDTNGDGLVSFEEFCGAIESFIG
jgi:Ca2+-binding EF-hand superfamily protein